jgi:hypothetical protein
VYREEKPKSEKSPARKLRMPHRASCVPLPPGLACRSEMSKEHSTCPGCHLLNHTTQDWYT